MSTRKQLLVFGAWAFLLNSILAILIGSRYLKYMDFSDIFTIVYIIITHISHFIFVLFLPFLFIYSPLILLWPNKRFAKILAGTLSVLCLIALATDSFVYDLYRFHINQFVLDMLFGGAFGQIFVINILLYLKIFGGIALLILVEIILLKLVSAFMNKKIVNYTKHILVVFVASLFFSHITHAISFAVYYKPIVKISRFYPLFYPLKANNVIYNFIDPKKYEGDIKVDIKNNSLKYPIHPIICDSTKNKYNILLITIDSWNYRTLNSSVTPNIQKLADSSLWFRNHFSGSNGTRGGIFSLFYALPALYWYDFESSQIGPVFIKEVLKNNYKTGIFANASLRNPAFNRTVFTEIANLRTDSHEKTVNERDVEITSEWINFTKQYINTNQSQPFFGFVFYDACHAMELKPLISKKFNPSWNYADYSSLNNKLNTEEFYNLYQNCAAFNDSLIGLIIQDLKDKKLFDNTILIITGDHGQEFNENKKNYWGHNGNYTRAQTGTNLVIHWPGKNSSAITYETSHFDIVPTLMKEVFNCKNPIDDYSIGKYLFDSTPRNWRISGSYDEFGIICENKIFNISFEGYITSYDTSMNELDNIKPNPETMNSILLYINKFHK